MKTLHNIYEDVYNSIENANKLAIETSSRITVTVTYHEAKHLRLTFLAIIDSEIERCLKQIEIHEHIINTHDVLPGEWHRGRIDEAKHSVTYLQGQRKLIEIKS